MNGQQEHDLNALAAYVEGRLEAGERRSVTEHLAGCRECRETAAALARSWPDVGERARVLRAPRWLGRAARSPWLAAAAVVVIGTAAAVRLVPPGTPLPARVAPDGSPPGTGSSATATAGRVAEGPAPRESAAVASPALRATVASPDTIDESLLVRRGAARRVAGRTFRLVAGEWVDSAFDRTSALPVVEVRGSAERQDVLARIGALAPYAALGDRVVVVHEGTVYRFGPAGGR